MKTDLARSFFSRKPSGKRLAGLAWLSDALITLLSLAHARFTKMRRSEQRREVGTLNIRAVIALALGLLLPAGYLLRNVHAANTYVVNSTADLPDADPADGVCATASGVCTLRAAIMQANFVAGPSMITVPAGLYQIIRVGYDDDALVGDLDIKHDLTIQGAGSSVTVVDGNGSVTHDRVLQILSTAQNVTLSGMTIRNGESLSLPSPTPTPAPTLGGGGLYIEGAGHVHLSDVIVDSNTGQNGGGIYANFSSTGGSLELDHVIVRSNTEIGSVGGGGGVFAYLPSSVSQLAIRDSQVYSNKADGTGGGLYVDGNSTTPWNIQRSEIYSNTAASGGAIGNFVPLSLSDSHLHNNSATFDGGAIEASSPLVILRTTFDSNTSGRYGGAIFSLETGSNALYDEFAHIEQSTLSSNSSRYGGAIYHDGFITPNSLLTLLNSTVSGNSVAGPAPSPSPSPTPIPGAAGAGIYVYGGQLQLLNATIARNRVQLGLPIHPNGGIGGGLYITASSTFNALNSLIANNTRGNGLTLDVEDDCWSSGTVGTLAFNLIRDTTNCFVTGPQGGNIVGQDPLLGPLQNNGGSTQTNALLLGSPAIDQGTKMTTLASDINSSTTAINVTDATFVPEGAGFAILIGSEQMVVTNHSALTTLSGNISAAQTTVAVADATNIPAGTTILIDGEHMLVASKSSNTLTVTRGTDGTTAATHLAGATVRSGNTLTVTRAANGTTATSHSAGASLHPPFDQRGPGFARTFDNSSVANVNGDGTDMGAFERQAVEPTPTPTPSPTPTPTFTILGQVTNSGGVGIQGVTVTLSGSQSGTAPTDASGNYSFTNIQAGGNFAVSASKSNLSFNPTSQSFSNLNSNGFANFIGTAVPTPTPTPTPPVSNVQFSSGSYSVNEGAGFATITVTRTGDTSGTVTVDYQTSDISAQQRTDYTIGAGTVTFGPGDTSKSFVVLIVNDLYVEGNETLTLTLSNPTGGAVLVSPSVATLTIVDNDSTSATTNPLDDARFFVQQHYYDFLSRYPDQGGWDFWTSQITQCGTDATCLRNKRIDVSNAYFYELEYQQTGAYVFRLYRAAFGNSQPFSNPDQSNPTEAYKLPAYAKFAFDRARVVGGSSLAQGQLDFATAFVQRPEFLAKYPANLDGSSFIDAVLNTIKNDLGVDLTAQKPGLLTLFNSGGRGAVMYRLADDNAQTNPINNRAFIDEEYNRAFVATQYFGYLRRDADIGGFLFWLGQVSSAPLRDVTKQHAMVCAFITSAEYQQRFSSIVTHSNSECQ